eukprot:364692-Chlamydomonas_euryale.AAC.3
MQSVENNMYAGGKMTSNMDPHALLQLNLLSHLALPWVLQPMQAVVHPCSRNPTVGCCAWEHWAASCSFHALQQGGTTATVKAATVKAALDVLHRMLPHAQSTQPSSCRTCLHQGRSRTRWPRSGASHPVAPCMQALH